jgi:hypothetical protein
MVKLYGLLWLAIATVALILFLGGVMTMPVVVVFGFISFGMVFMGMIGVLPTMVSHHSTDVAKPIKEAEKGKQRKIHRPAHV